MKKPINDGIVSFNTSLGEASESRIYKPNSKATDSQFQILYENDWVVQKYINGLAKDMLRKDRSIKSDLEKGVDKKIEEWCKRYSVYSVAEEYICWGDLYGDSIVLAVTKYSESDEPVNMSQPLDLNREELVKFIVFDKNSYLPSNETIDDLSNSLFGKSLSYELKFGEKKNIHYSRICRKQTGNVPLSKAVKGGRQSYGTSKVKGIWNALIAYNTAKTGISDLIEKCKVYLMKTKGFNQHIADGREDDYLEIARVIKRSLSSSNIGIFDEDSQFESIEVTSTWVNDALKEARIDLSGACNRPLTRLFGQSASGFASGEEDNRIYYEYVNGEQESYLRPLWNFFDMFMIDDFKNEDENFNLASFDYDFPSIGDMSEKELAELANAYADYLGKLFDVDAIDSVMILKEMKNKGFLSSLTDEDIAKKEAEINDPAYQKPTQEPTQYQGY